jgi:hypothetical protein
MNLKIQMQSKIIHNNANPEWKQELKLGVKVNLKYFPQILSFNNLSS